MTIETELLAIKGNKELLLAEDVVEWARSHPQSALARAPEFCGFDVKKSAYEHWLWGARRLIAIHIVYEGGGRKFISLSIDRVKEKGGYRDIDQVLHSRDLHQIMLADALADLERVQARYEQLKDLKPVWRVVSQIRRKQNNRKAGGNSKRKAA